MSDVDKVRADIELTRSELADTIDALQAKLDVRAITRQRAEQARMRASEVYSCARASAPPAVRGLLERAGQAAAPLLEKAKHDPKRAGMVVGGALLALLVLRRTIGD